MKLLFYKNKRYQRAGIFNKDKLVHYYEDFFANKDSKDNKRGQIFIGIITRIEKSLNAVFISYGSEKDGFLSFTSIHPKYFNLKPETYNNLMLKLKKEDNIRKSSFYNESNLGNFLRIGQKIMVQVIRNARDTKGVMLSTFLILKGKFVVYNPLSINPRLLLSEEINETNRNFLEDIFYEMVRKELISGSLSIKNFINKQSLKSDVDQILKLWNSIEKNKNIKEVLYKEDNFKNLIYSHLASIDQIIYEDSGDFFDKDILNSLISNSRTSSSRTSNSRTSSSPTSNSRTSSSPTLSFQNISIQKGRNVFKKYEEEINSINSNIVQLVHGGYIIFDKNQCCTTIDINIGRNKKSYDKCNLETNADAIREIFRHIRLRNINGIIIVDLVGMSSDRDIEFIEAIIDEEVQRDFCKVEVTSISKFGILQICRQYQEIGINHMENCFLCSNGKIEPIFLVGEKLLREISYKIENNPDIEVHLSSQLTEFFINNLTEDINTLKQKANINFFINVNTSNPNYYQILETKYSYI